MHSSRLSGDLEALCGLHRRAYSDKINEPEQLKIWRDVIWPWIQKRPGRNATRQWLRSNRVRRKLDRAQPPEMLTLPNAPQERHFNLLVVRLVCTQ